MIQEAEKIRVFWAKWERGTVHGNMERGPNMMPLLRRSILRKNIFGDCVCAVSVSHVLLFATPWTVAPRLLCGISQARILERLAISCSRRSSQPRDGTRVYCLAGGVLSTEPPGKPIWRLGVWILTL